MYSKIMVPNNEYNLQKKDFLIEECIKNIADGNTNSLADLYNITKTSVYGFSLSILKNPHDAEDVLQDVYVKIYENAYTYKSRGKPLAWILTITKNLSYMKIRGQKEEVDISELQEVLTNNSNIINEDKELLLAAFKVLTDEERNILILHANNGFKHREIAKILELPLSTVLSKYNRAIKKIKENLSKEDII